MAVCLVHYSQINLCYNFFCCAQKTLFHRMPPPQRIMTLGADTVVSVLMKYIYPSECIQNNYHNRQGKQWLEGLKVLRLETKKVWRKDQECVVFVTDDFVNNNGNPIKLYASRRFVVVTKQRPKELFFGRG